MNKCYIGQDRLWLQCVFMRLPPNNMSVYLFCHLIDIIANPSVAPLRSAGERVASMGLISLAKASMRDQCPVLSLHLISEV